MSASNDWKLTPGEQDRLTVLRQQDKAQREIEAKANNVLSSTNGSVRASESLLARYGIAEPLSRQATKRSVDAFLHYGPGRRF